jgi:hypothetical protein
MRRPPLNPAPRAPPRGAEKRFGAVAQLGERCNGIAEVRGSIPLGSTNPPENLTAFRGLASPALAASQIDYVVEVGQVREDGNVDVPYRWLLSGSRQSRTLEEEVCGLDIKSEARIVILVVAVEGISRNLAVSKGGVMISPCEFGAPYKNKRVITGPVADATLMPLSPSCLFDHLAPDFLTPSFVTLI